MEKIILNGLIDWVSARIDEYNSNTTIGIVHEIKMKTFTGEITVDRKEKSIFELLNTNYFYNKFACVSFVTSDSEIDDPAFLVEGYLLKYVI